MKGKFITLEGIEGSGKSTSLKDITAILDECSIKYITTKEPGGGPLGPDLRSMLLNKDLGDCNWWSFCETETRVCVASLII